MPHLIRTECRKIGLPALLTTAVLAVVMSVLSCTLYQNYTLYYDLEAWEVGTEWLSLLYPLFVVIPLCWNLYHERKNNFLLYVMPRVPVRRYLTAKWIAYALGAFSIMAVPYLLSAVCALFLNAPVVPPAEGTFSHVFQSAFTQAPLCYAVLLSCWRGLIGVLMMSFGFVLALYCKNMFVILTGPFMYAILENFILSILHLERYRLVVAFDPTCVDDRVVSALSLVVGPVLLLLVIGLTAFFLARVLKNAVVTV